MHDVVVVGAGPTGCYAARELARLGYGVLVLEEHAEVGEPVHCTGVLGAEIYQRFDLDSTCVQDRLSSARFISPSGRSFRVASDQPPALLVDRRKFDRSLAQQALSAGASFLLGAKADHIAVTDDKAVVHTACLGERLSFPTALVILATGAEDPLARELGLAERSAPPMFGGQLFVQNRALEEVEIHLSPTLAPGGFAWAVPVNGNGCRVGLLTSKHAPQRLQRFARALETRGAIHRNGAAMTCRAIPTGPRTPSFADRVLVIGDAAGQVKSTTTGGISFGLLGADAAVRTAHQALRTGDVSAARLARYEQQWLGKIGAEQRLGRMLRRVHATLTDRDIEALFWLVHRTGLPRMFSRLRFDWHTAGLLTLLWRDLIGAATTGPRRTALDSEAN